MPPCTRPGHVVLTSLKTTTALLAHFVDSHSTRSGGASPQAVKLATLQWGEWPQSLAGAQLGQLQIRDNKGGMPTFVFPACSGACALIHFRLEIPERCAGSLFLLGRGQNKREREWTDLGANPWPVSPSSGEQQIRVDLPSAHNAAGISCPVANWRIQVATGYWWGNGQQGPTWKAGRYRFPKELEPKAKIEFKVQEIVRKSCTLPKSGSSRLC